MKSGIYEVEYETAEPLKKSYSIDSTIEELLGNPTVRKFLGTMMDVDMIPDLVYNLSLRNVAKIFAGEIDEEQAAGLNAMLEKF